MLETCLLRVTLSRTPLSCSPRVFSRHKSITAAIERGKQYSDAFSTPRRSDRIPRNRYQIVGRPRDLEADQPERSNGPYEGDFNRRAQWRKDSEALSSLPNDGISVKNFESLPYTTAASEFLYGYSTVLAALKAGRRQLYSLYVHTRGSDHKDAPLLLARARAARINIREVGESYLQAMDKASSGRPHNGFILEASPLPQPLIAALSTFSIQKNYFEVDVKRQSREEELINKPQKRHYYKSAGWRHPLLLYVDGVLDEGNLGAIARSAYFLGVDAIATPMRSTAPWSQIALKASAGAAEAIPVFAVSDPSTFLGQSTRQGWRIYASDVIPSEQPGERPLASLSSPLSADPARDLSSRVVYTYARSTRRLPPGHSPVSIHPTILMMGAESTGLRGSLLNQANFKVGILHGRDQDEIGVDSLNVSAAASILCYEMLQKPKPARKQGDYLF